MSRVKKRNQYLAKIALIMVEDNESCKDPRQTEKAMAFSIQKNQEKDFCDKYYKNRTRNNNSDESSIKKKKKMKKIIREVKKYRQKQV